MNDDKQKRYLIDRAGLPVNYPTHTHRPEFWEALGRAVATFGFLEEVLLKAIFAITATTRIPEAEAEKAYAEWIKKLERSLSDPLGNLIDKFGKAVRENQDSTLQNLDDLLEDLRNVASIRNAICHGSWPPPDANGACVPFYVNRKGEKFETSVDIAYLAKVKDAAIGLACSVIDTVTHMGWQFPSSNGPGHIIWNR
jgi:hypothetical protein